MAEIARPTQRYRAQDLERLADSDKRYELLQGTLIEMPPPSVEHGLIVASLIAALLPFIQSHQLGQLMTETGFQLASDPDTVRAPDVAFVSRARLMPRQGSYYPFAPDLAVEVVSPANSASAMQAKIVEYFEKGARQVWIIYPTSRTLYLYTAPKRVRILDANDTLEGGDLLPNFSLPIRELFSQLDLTIDAED
jgi:Uma2 family endonuclease